MGKILIIVAILLILAGGGFYYYQSTQKPAETAKEEEKSDESVTPTEEPTPADVKNDAYTIELLNGSGIAGEAGRAQELLEGEEFKIDSTGNAENYDFEDTVIQAGSDVEEAWVDALRDTLGKNYTVKSGVTKLDSADSESDVVVIVGSFDEDGNSMAVEEEETTATATPAPTSGSTEVTATPSPSPSTSTSPTPTP